MNWGSLFEIVNENQALAADTPEKYIDRNKFNR